MALPLKTILITGANRGIGLEVIRQLAANPGGPEVVIAACRDPSKATDLQRIAKSDARVKVIRLDVGKDEDIESAVKETDQLVGSRGLNYLLNNAGLYEGGMGVDSGIYNINRESMQRHFDINVSAPLVLTQKFLPLIKRAAQQKSSRDLNCQAGVGMMASIMGSQTLTAQQGIGESLTYKCSKSAITMGSILLSRELAPEGIHCVAIHPGWAQTDMGGNSAQVSVPDSARGVISIIASSSKLNNGKLVNYDLSILPY